MKVVPARHEKGVEEVRVVGIQRQHTTAHPTRGRQGKDKTRVTPPHSAFPTLPPPLDPLSPAPPRAAAGPTSGPGSLQSPRLNPLEYLDVKLSSLVCALLGLPTPSTPASAPTTAGDIVKSCPPPSSEGLSRSKGSERNFGRRGSISLWRESRYSEGTPAPLLDRPRDRRTSAT